MPSRAVIGRDREADDLEGRTNTHRLVTVVGPGGVGKTALVRAVADRVAGRFALGVAGVDLTRITDASAVPGALAAQLGFDSFDALLTSPSDRPMLLVVDNCEHLLDAAADSLVQILGACRQPTVLATSRSPLELPGESVLSLSPLPLPTDEEDPLASPSIQLFLQRCRDAGAAQGDHDISAVVELCRRLDGLPLALEIAAARTRTLSVGEITTRLAGGVGVLDRPRFRGDPRHRSVADTIRWSYDLLPDGSAELFERLSVLPGTFNVDLARSLVPAGRSVEVDGDLEEILNASLASVDTSGPETRYRLLGTVRRFALERLRDRDEVGPTYDRFVDHLLSSTAVDPAGDPSPDHRRAVQDSYDHVAEALAWCLSHDDDPDRAHALGAVLGTIVAEGHADDVIALTRQTLDRWPDRTAAGASATLAALAMAEYLTGHPERAVELAETPTTAGAADRDAVMLLAVLGRARQATGDRAGALDALDSGAQLARALHAESAALELEIDAAEILSDGGDADSAIDALVSIGERAAASGAHALSNRAATVRAWVQVRVDPAAALPGINTALAGARELEDPNTVAVNLRSRAYAELLLDELGAATATVGELLEEVLHRSTMANARVLLDAATALAFRRGHPAWPSLAATGRGLPRPTMTNALLEVSPAPPADATPLPRHDTIVAVREVVADLVADTPPPAAARAARGDAAPVGTIRRNGEVWEIDFAGRTTAVRASKGLHDLIALIQASGREIHCLDLAGAAAVEPSTGELIDAESRRRYEERIRDLQTEIDEAERHSDHGRAFRLQVEFDAIVEQLSAALGQGNRARRAADTAERARSAVTHRLRATIHQLDKLHPALGRHLSHAVNTGAYCSYRPENPITWFVS